MAALVLLISARYWLLIL